MYHDQLNWLSTIYATFTVLESPHLIFAYGINKTPLTGWRLGDAADHAQRDARLVGRHLHGVKDEIEDHMRIIERKKKSASFGASRFKDPAHMGWEADPRCSGCD